MSNGVRRVVVMALTLTASLNCGTRTDLSAGDGVVAASGNEATGGIGGTSGALGSAAGQPGKGGATGGGQGQYASCTECVVKNGPTGCKSDYNACLGSCASLRECAEQRACYDDPYIKMCPEESCSELPNNFTWQDFAFCAECLPECQAVCKIANYTCPPPKPDSCAHDECVTGDALASGCSSCAKNVCKFSVDCCGPNSKFGWSANCALLAKDLCGKCDPYHLVS